MMINEVKIPVLGEGIDSAEVISILVKEGDSVIKTQPLLELESDKATVELPSPVSGIIEKINIQNSDTISIGQVVMNIKMDDLPITTENIQREEIQSNKNITETAVFQSQKTKEKNGGWSTRHEAEHSGLYMDHAEIEILNVPPASPSIRRFARELGADIRLISGSGHNQRISEDDVKAYVRKIMTDRKQLETSGSVISTSAHLDEIKPLSGTRKKTAENMSASWRNIPHVTQYDEADITEVEKFRKKYNEKAPQTEGRLTLTAVIIKITAMALKKFTKFNASFAEETYSIIYKKSVNIGVAVDTERGLFVPVIHDANLKSLSEIGFELQMLSKKARERKISTEELSGGTFSISNLGSYGTTYFSPIIKPPEAAILGVGRSKTEPVYDHEKKNFGPRNILPLSLSYDHRLIDGAEAARFLRFIAEALENSMTML